MARPSRQVEETLSRLPSGFDLRADIKSQEIMLSYAYVVQLKISITVIARLQVQLI